MDDGPTVYHIGSKYHACMVAGEHAWFTVNPFRPKFTVVIFIHHKPRIAVAILDL